MAIYQKQSDQQIEALKEYADIVLDNNGAPGELSDQLMQKVDTRIDALLHTEE